MMQIGMWVYRVEPIESPKRLRNDKQMQEHKVNVDRKADYQQLLQEEIDAGIVV
jgi:hypothetical protein